MYRDYKYINAGSMTADVAGESIDMLSKGMLSIQAIWTGTPAGNFTIEISNDGGTTWSTYTGSTVAAGGAAGDHVWEITAAPSKAYRLYYTVSSSTGTLNAYNVVKGEI
ncbi:MAG: hypothetical protein GY861_01025 [bacterium]|nr:hypothetical protein [bacterium]